MSNIAKFTPSAGFILIKIKETNSSPIETVKDLDKDPVSTGEVISIGATKLHESGEYYGTQVKVGEMIVFKPYGIDTLVLDTEEYRIVPFENVRGVLNEK